MRLTEDDKIAPTLHRNGSGLAHLEEAIEAQTDAIRAAIRIVQENCPNARDYYPQGDGAAARAVQEHADRIRALDRVLQDLLTIRADLIDQADEQRARRAGAGS